jgi:hypothetical protein
MKLRAVRRPDGSIEIDGVRYRLREQDDRFEVVREDGGAALGAFRIRDVSHGFEVDAPDSNRAIVQAVAKLFAAPRGVLPLQ